MIEHINSNTIRLTPGQARQSCARVRSRPRKALNSLERLMVDSVKDALTKRLWYERQLRRSADYEAALEERGCHKTRGMFGWSCPEGTRVMRQDEGLPF